MIDPVRPHDGLSAASGCVPEPRRQLKVLSLGGCMTHDVCRKAACLEIAHVDHLWRRPTISLMSRPVRQMPFLDGNFPPELARYWQDDFRKTHLRELHEQPRNILVFDVTRDVLCTLIEVEELCFVLDPMSVKGMMWQSDSIDDDKVNAVTRQATRRINYFNEGYFETWRSYFDDFAAVARRFDAAIVNRLYFTDRIASEQPLTHGDPVVVEAANRFLDEAYDYIASTHRFIHINTIPRRLLVTGPDVAWGGPAYTHLQNEATTLFAERLRDNILGHSPASGGLLLECAIERMNRHEDLLRSHRGIIDERDGLAERLRADADSYRGQIDEARHNAHLLLQERDALQARLHELERRVAALSDAAGKDEALPIAAE